MQFEEATGPLLVGQGSLAQTLISRFRSELEFTSGTPVISVAWRVRVEARLVNK
jgi:hypothetical protein